jgi:Rrf2 family protein
MISKTAEYALRAVVFLAMNADSAYTGHQIADQTKVPSAYLSKVLKSLVSAGLIQSQPGLRGGFTLVKQSHELNLLEVLNAVEPLQRIRTCPLGLKSHGTVLCALHRRLDDSMKNIEHAFAETTIATLLANPTPSIPLYENPCNGHGCARG